MIPINYNKKLCDNVIEKIRDKLQSITYLSEIYPAVSIEKRADGTTMPVVYAQAGGVKLYAVVPDSTIASFVFFEKGTYKIDTDESGINSYNLSLTFWGQAEKISTAEFDVTDQIINDILGVLRKFNVENIEVATNAAFDGYNFDSGKKYLMYPNISFKINFTIFASNCI